jgi:predicted porin
VDAALLWLRATEDVSINGGPADSDLGWEVDWKGTYKLARNLSYWVEGGYLFTGDAYQFPGNVDADNAFALRHGVQLSF